jgi:peptidoglycan-N-acetylglucosamine deacetylase
MMKNINKPLKIIVFILVFIFVLGLGLFQISKSRSFQFFGILVNHIKINTKVVALTFDDAPTEYTQDVLNILNEKQVKATFFVIGKNLAQFPQIGQEIVANGHELGNHSYTHQRMILKSQSFISTEIEKTSKLIRNAGFTGEIVFRPPNGKKLFGLPWYLNQHQMKTIMWDVEPDTYGKSTDFLVKYTLDHVKPGSIILLHPFCNDCQNDRAAIGKIIDGLHAKGYQFVTISQILMYYK